MKIQPIGSTWQKVEITDADGIVTSTFAMVPALRFSRIAQRQFSEGEEYPIVVMQARSRASHSQYFAALKDGYDNLPEKIQARWPSVEHLRKWLLCQTEWHYEKEFRFEGRDAEKQAKRLALFSQTEDEYAQVSIHRIVAGEDNREAALDKGVEAFLANEGLDVRERLRLVVRETLKALDKGGVYKVIIKKAMSQDHRSMGHESFQKSKSDVLELLEQFVGVKRGELMKNAGRAS